MVLYKSMESKNTGDRRMKLIFLIIFFFLTILCFSQDYKGVEVEINGESWHESYASLSEAEEALKTAFDFNMNYSDTDESYLSINGLVLGPDDSVTIYVDPHNDYINVIRHGEPYIAPVTDCVQLEDDFEEVVLSDKAYLWINMSIAVVLSWFVTIVVGHTIKPVDKSKRVRWK